MVALSDEYPPEGSAMDVKDHPSNTVPDATQHFAGEVLPMPGAGGSGHTNQASDYALGKAIDVKVKSIGESTLRDWADRVTKRK